MKKVDRTSLSKVKVIRTIPLKFVCIRLGVYVNVMPFVFIKSYSDNKQLKYFE